ncbi:PWI domain-containing protein [Caenorhabditis elegans]|uniref:PWI domain-containing protein n=1 Tax=Caenorhabditis elegans TaxID=6239 RepID=Q8I4F3_CAEEL|nr:PWI domain-containing protein [Caenorhabditis elegans]CAA99936.3 PWI domain-containing protein [Caenorhabditis elegans]|eukprot:NP_506134.3 RNA Binding Motif protein homolog [Caenorhabditis elegans]
MYNQPRIGTRYDEHKRNRNRRSRSRTRSRERTSRRSRSKESPRSKRSRRSRSSSNSSSESDSSSSRSSSYSSRSRSRTPQRSRTSKRRRSNSHASEDSDDAREKRAFKQMMLDKKQAYLARLKRWESRERQMSKRYEREERKEKDRKKTLQKEGKRLKLFLEDYDDEKDDPKYYTSSQFFQRKRDYEREREADQKDRMQEQQEIEELKRQIMEEAANDESINIEEEARKRHKLKEEEAMRKMRADSGSPNPHQPLGQSANGEKSSSEEESDSEKTDVKKEIKDEIKEEPIDVDISEHVDPNTGSSGTNGNFGWKAIGDDSSLNTKINRPIANGNQNQPQIKKEASPIPIAQRLSGVFGNDDDEDDVHSKKKLKPFEITREERMQVMSAEEKRELTKQIIKTIPATKDELFVHRIEWDQLDGKWMNDRIRPWVAKKVTQFLGEEDKSFCDFICDQIEKQATPQEILKDVAVIIDEDAEQFVIKMWRLLIYEGQARRLGIT